MAKDDIESVALSLARRWPPDMLRDLARRLTEYARHPPPPHPNPARRPKSGPRFEAEKWALSLEEEKKRGKAR